MQNGDQLILFFLPTLMLIYSLTLVLGDSCWITQDSILDLPTPRAPHYHAFFLYLSACPFPVVTYHHTPAHTGTCGCCDTVYTRLTPFTPTLHAVSFFHAYYGYGFVWITPPHLPHHYTARTILHLPFFNLAIFLRFIYHCVRAHRPTQYQHLCNGGTGFHVTHATQRQHGSLPTFWTTRTMPVYAVPFNS